MIIYITVCNFEEKKKTKMKKIMNTKLIITTYNNIKTRIYIKEILFNFKNILKIVS